MNTDGEGLEGRESGLKDEYKLIKGSAWVSGKVTVRRDIMGAVSWSER